MLSKKILVAIASLERKGGLTYKPVELHSISPIRAYSIIRTSTFSSVATFRLIVALLVCFSLLS